MPRDPQKTVLITGAARRIGATVARAMAADGWAVAVHHHRSTAEAEALAESIRAGGGAAAALAADLADEAQVATLVPRAAAALGPVTCLVNNASVFEEDAVDTATRESWDRHMETNLRAPFVLIQSLQKQLPADTVGNVINIIDQRVWNLTPHFTSYTLSKAGLWTLTRTLALALAPRIRVNGIGPGPTLPSPRQSGAEFEAQWRAMPLGRPVAPEEIAAAVRFILDAPSLTGQMIALDSGQHLGWSQAGEDGGARE
ncbi:MAG: SDR family oxidoreductase [Hyphomicrobiales bacterium]|nr:SDR family oxidoreductase [Hyphomicrobiales bacterium]MCP5372304.1 SDR family oxidoreductase [Hyphomicrobiales bacterium]